MEILRTPDNRFENLDGFAFSPNYVNVPAGDPDGQQLRVHYLDEGPAHQCPVLLMHGEPSWSYLYRKMIPILVKAGHRVIAPDLVGFGRSDKPADTSDYSYNQLVSWMEAALITELDLSDITLFCQDWGGLIGLRLVAAHPDRFAGVMAANTGMPVGNTSPPQAFLEWQMFSQAVPEFPTSIIVQGGCETELTPAELAAYEAPFPDETFKSGARILPTLVPTTPEDPAREAQIEAWKSLAAFNRPFLTAFSDKDAVTAGGEAVFQNKVAGARDQKHVTIEGGGHFLQEDEPQQICDHLLALITAG
jgi:haloalkane dehalogenase